jgi:thioredoxin-dependent peroxiredoxin
MSKLWFAAVAALGLTVAAGAQQTPVELKEGDAAPAFTLPGSDGKNHSLSDYKGKAVVLAWFPAAFTGG